jgi:hypothetical protein
MAETEYIHRLTVACPEELVEAANHLALAIGEGPGDFYSFGVPQWQNEDGTRFSVISTAATNLLFAYAGSQLQKRDFAPEEWSAEKAFEAQSVTQIWFGPSEEAPEVPKAEKGKLLGVVGDDIFGILAAMGLSRIPEEF